MYSYICLMINLSFRYTPEILQEAYTLHYKKNSLLQGRLLLFLGVLLIWTGLLLVLVSKNEGRQVLNYSFVSYGLIIIMVYIWMMNTLGKRAFKKLKKYPQTIEISVNEESIVMKTEKGEAPVQWSDFQLAVVSVSMILLYPSKYSFYIFPKKDFKEGDFDSFTELVREKITRIK